MYFLARSKKATIGVSISAGISFGIGVNAAAGMAVDEKGNAAIFFVGGLPLDNHTLTLNDRKIGFGASLMANYSEYEGKLVTDLSGGGFVVGGSVANGVAAGMTYDFSVASDGKVSFLGNTKSIGLGTPGVSATIAPTSTYAALFSKEDYSQIFDRQWDKEGVKAASDWDRATNEDMGKPEGLWQYVGSEMIFEKTENKDEFSVSVKQSFIYNQSGTGKEGRHNEKTTRVLDTGVKMKKTDNNTLMSSRLRN